MKRTIVFGLLFSAQIAFGNSLSFSDFEMVGKNSVAKVATLNGQTLQRIGTGVREKKIIFVGVSVYRATLFGADASFMRDTKGTLALDSLQNMKARVLQLKFIRAVSAADVAKSFEAALRKNDVKDYPSLVAFKTAVKGGGDLAVGDVVSIAVDKDKKLLICDQGKNHIEIQGDDKLFRDVFSIWLGKPADSGLSALRNTLIKGM